MFAPGSTMSKTAKTPEYSVIVPVYQSDKTVVELVARTSRVFDETLKASFEILLIDDGSDNPDTWPTLEQLARENPNVRAIRLTRNFGKPSVILCGFHHVRGDWVVTIDDDLQQIPEDIPALAAHRDHDVVVARYPRLQFSWHVALTGRIKRMFDAKVLGLPVRMTPFRICRRSVIDAVLKMQAGRPYIPALLARVTSDFVDVPLEHHPSKVGPSRYNYWRRMRQFGNLIISYSGLFARVWGLIGGVSVVLGILAGLLTLLFADGATSFWGGLILSAIFLIGGLILMALGIVGEYLIRIVELTSKRPPYVVRDTIPPGS